MANVFWIIISIIVLVFIIYALFFSTNNKITATGFLVLGVILLWWAISSFVSASTYYRLPQV